MSDEKTAGDSNFVTHSNIDKEELKTFMDNVGSKVIKEVIEEYNKEPLDSETKMSDKKYTAHELLVNAVRNLPTAEEMVNSQKMTGETENPYRFEEFTTEYASHILGIGPNVFTGEKYKQIDSDKLLKMNKMMEKYHIVRTAIREKHPQGNEFIQDTIPCPICKDGTVAFIISDHYNGHIHAKCSNGCVDWME
jgi:hypothetical protein